MRVIEEIPKVQSDALAAGAGPAVDARSDDLDVRHDGCRSPS